MPALTQAAEQQRRHHAKRRKRRPTVTPAVPRPVTPTVTVERHGSVMVTTATLIAALALATRSAGPPAEPSATVQ